MDLQDPLRLRLIGHLQCYSAQREASAVKSCGGVAGGPPSAPPPPPPPHPWNQHHQYPQPSAPSASAVMPMQNLAQHPAAFDHPHAGAGCYLEALGRGPGGPQAQSNMRLTSSVGGMDPSQLSVSSPATGASSSHVMPSTQPSAAAASLFGVHHAAQFLPMLSPNGLHYGSSAAAAAMLGQGVKPYRPWGAELAY